MGKRVASVQAEARADGKKESNRYGQSQQQGLQTRAESDTLSQGAGKKVVGVQAEVKARIVSN